MDNGIQQNDCDFHKLKISVALLAMRKNLDLMRSQIEGKSADSQWSTREIIDLLGLANSYSALAIQITESTDFLRKEESWKI